MKTTAIILGILLILSNAFWVYELIDIGVTKSFQDQQLYQLEETRKQIMSMMPDLAKNLPKERVIEIASRYTDKEGYEKGNCSWVGWIGLKFDQTGELEFVSPIWSFGEQNPCFQYEE